MPDDIVGCWCYCCCMVTMSALLMPLTFWIYIFISSLNTNNENSDGRSQKKKQGLGDWAWRQRRLLLYIYVCLYSSVQFVTSVSVMYVRVYVYTYSTTDSIYTHNTQACAYLHAKFLEKPEKASGQHETRNVQTVKRTGIRKRKQASVRSLHNKFSADYTCSVQQRGWKGTMTVNLTCIYRK